jgi:hypothetical protein
MDDKEELVMLPNARVTASHFWISDTPADDMVNHVEASLVDKGLLDLDDGPLAWTVVSVTVSMTNAEDDSDVRMTASATVRAEVTYRSGDDIDESYVSCISECLSLSMSQIHVSTALSPMNLVTIPKLDARKVLDAATGKDE